MGRPEFLLAELVAGGVGLKRVLDLREEFKLGAHVVVSDDHGGHDALMLFYGFVDCLLGRLGSSRLLQLPLRVDSHHVQQVKG